MLPLFYNLFIKFHSYVLQRHPTTLHDIVFMTLAMLSPGSQPLPLERKLDGQPPICCITIEEALFLQLSYVQPRRTAESKKS